ncbi:MULTISPECIES: hypothetical protein [Rhodococcus]|jgi:hypothetical protein|uniref:hypothetical protein n=1 Tax=Rhodococcus TaxID=1827 RepID=UPI0013873E03|nr:hypothetical protein [Rhodococcus aetherivorans]MBC2591642.1 hypothetical protein [Rhodococcus aetherivorans]NCL76454.1 hypothetical protein [Rhodococcus sp. YH1]
MEAERDQLLLTVRNLARFHREHEKFYSESPFHDVIRLHRSSRALKALAERWSVVAPLERTSPSPFAGAPDLNDDRATETLGILFMESGDEPAEITRLKADLGALAEANRTTGQWLADAMATAWDVLEALLAYPGLADLLAERHRIVTNDWQCATTAQLVARNLDRAVAILGRIDFTAAALRADLAGDRIAPRYVFSAAEMIDHAADLAAQSAVLTHENERRWRIFHDRVEQIVAGPES